MGYRSARNTSVWLNSRREWEERKLNKKKFTARYSRATRLSLVVLTGIMLLIAAIQVLAGERDTAAVILLLTSPMLLLLPTALSYRCEVDGTRMRESWLILCIPRRKEVLWKDIRSRRVRRDQWDHIISIRLYDEKGRKVFSMGRDITGVGLICHMAREKGIPNRK